MKGKKAIKGVLAAIFAAILALICVFATACDTVNYQGQVARFKPYDYSRMERAYERAESAIADGRDPFAMVMRINDVTNELNDILSNYIITNIEYHKDNRGPFAEQYQLHRGYYDDAYTKYITVLHDAMASPLGEDLFEGWSKEDIDMVEEQYARRRDSRYLELQSQLTELQMQYDSLAVETTATYANAAQAILLKIVDVNNSLAELAGYSSYVNYAYADYGRTYVFDEAVNLSAYIKEYISPILDGIAEVRSREKAAVSDKLSEDAKYGNEIERCGSYIRDYTKEIGQYMVNAYNFMRDNDLHYSATKRDNPNGTRGAFTTYLYGSNAPYVYQYCDGGYRDLLTYIHEFGHFTSFYNNGSSGGSELDVAEIQSQANEMLFLPYLSKIYGEEVGAYLECDQIYNILTSAVIMGCLFDEFQRDIYAAPENYTQSGAMTAHFDELVTEYGATSIAETWDNPEEFKYWWAQVSHTFDTPFYYISYAVSAVPALVIYEYANTPSVGRDIAIGKYKDIQAHGHSGVGGKNLLDLLKYTGVGSPFEETTIKDLANFLNNRFSPTSLAAAA